MITEDFQAWQVDAGSVIFRAGRVWEVKEIHETDTDVLLFTVRDEENEGNIFPIEPFDAVSVVLTFDEMEEEDAESLFQDS